MNPGRLTPLATFAFLVAFALANLAAGTGATSIHGTPNATAPVVLAATGTPAAEDGLGAVEDEPCSRRAITRAGSASRRAAASPAPLLGSDESVRFAGSVPVDHAPPLERPLARRAADVFTIRGPPLG